VVQNVKEEEVVTIGLLKFSPEDRFNRRKKDALPLVVALNVLVG